MRARALAAAVLGLVACGPDNLLSGSVSEVFPLDVSRVEVAKNDEALQVTYLRNRGVFLDVVIKVGVSLVSTTGLPDGGVQRGLVELKSGTKFDLAGEYEPGHPKATVAHAPGGEPLRLLPRVKRGDLVISSGGALGQPIKGTFSMLFESEGGDVGQGRTLSGSFAGTVLDAGFGPLN